MPSSVLRRHASGLAPQRYPGVRSPWLSLPTEVDWTATAGVAVTPGASNVKSAYVELFASLAKDCDAIAIEVTDWFVNAQSHPILADIATGAAASEVDVVPNFSAGYSSEAGRKYLFPVGIKGGTRVSIRAQDAHATPPAGKIRAIALKLPYGASPTKLVNYGAVTATSLGVAVTTAATWTEITSATTEAYQGLVLTYGGNTDTAIVGTGDASDAISLGIGAAASEVEILRAILIPNGAEKYLQASSGFNMLYTGHVAKGTRIAVKGSNATTNQLDATVIGVPYGR